MNRGTYRLVFNTARGTWMAVNEWARGHGKRSVRQRASAAVAVCAMISAAVAEARAPLPVERRVPVPAATFVTRGTAADPVTVGSHMTITQESQKAVLNWDSFDIESGYRVTFSHPNAAAATLNKIGFNSPIRSPSEIRGLLESIARDTGGTGGAIYLVNRNGILFAEGAQVNVGGLVASSLDIADDVFENGLLSVRQGTENTKADPVFTWGGDDAQYATSLVEVEVGANIATSQEGRVMLLAPRVKNAGNITTPQGQAILAAGSKVYLAAPASGSKLRGFLVEVDAGVTPGIATNLGQIVAERGNITLAALAVNQMGRLSATTTVDMNGSIYLQARDTVVPGYQETASDGSSVYNPLATRMGTLTFGAGSVTEVVPETSSAHTLRDDQTFNKSEIAGSGKTILIEGATTDAAGARLTATAGEITLTAQGDLTGSADRFDSTPDAAARIHVGAGATLDVSGLRDVALSVERNIVEAELRGNELKDSPLQRTGILAGQKVLIDIRKGTPLADVSGYVAGLQRGIAEKSAAGGTVTLQSEGDVILRQGSTVDVSGGSLNYAGGDTGTTRLVAGNRSVDIAGASPLLTYAGFVKDTYRYEAGYVEGKDAGTFAVDATKVVLDGALHGSTVAGIHQRTVASRPAGARLELNGLGSAVRFVNGEAALAAGFGAADPLGDTPLLLAADIFNVNGFNRLALSTSGDFSLPENVRLTAWPGGDFSITARTVDVQGGIATAGGTISLATLNTTTNDPAAAALVVGAGARLSTAGTRVSDLRTASTGNGGDPVVLGGGVINLISDGDLMLAAGSELDVSGGAWLQSDGKAKFGNAGGIRLASGTLSQSARHDARMSLDGTLKGYGLSDGATTGKGGTLDITASNVSIGGAALGRAGELHLDEAFFQGGGFASHAIKARDELTVAAGARVKAAPESLVLTHGSGRNASLLWTAQQLSDYLRQPGSLELSTLGRIYGDLTVGTGAYLGVDAGGSIKLASERSIYVDGTLQAQGGEIVLSQSIADALKDEYQADRAIWLGANSRLLAQGYVRLDPSANGLRRGTVHDGGSVEIDAAKGYLVAEAGTLIDVSGTAATLDLAGAATRGGTTVGSAGGRVNLAAREGMLLDGDFKAQGGTGALGGALTVDIDHSSAMWTPFNSVFDPAGNGTPLAQAIQTQVQSARRLVLTPNHDAGTGSMSFGQEIDPFVHNGLATLATGKVQAAGFADVTLKSENRIELAGTVALTTQRSITLDTPNLKAQPNASATLAAALISLGNTNVARQNSFYRDDASGGSGTLTATADHLVLAGTLTQQGFGTTTLNSTGDIEARAVAVDGAYRGAFISGGDINLNADRIYPSTLSDFAVEIHSNPSGRITTGHYDKRVGDGKTVMSAGGRLALVAPSVTHGGTLMAPFGTLELRSDSIMRVNDVEVRTARPDGGTVALEDGSITSVSGDGQTILFGQTQLAGEEWVYALGEQVSRVIGLAPEKRIVLDGDSISKAENATVDLSGGGDMLAWEFLPGTGGSKDVLDSASSPNTYAILPAYNGNFAAYDQQSWAGSNLSAGERIVLTESVGGLAAGTYVLLPARYALLPGAYTVTFTGQTDARAGLATAIPGGGWRAAAYRSTATLGGQQRATLGEYVEIAPGDIARTRSEYIETRASEFFAGGASRLPGDAGQLAVRAGSSLTLAGSLNTAHAATHRGAEVDIAANKLVVRGTQAAQADYSGFVVLDAASLNGLGAESIALGGIRGRNTDGTTLAVSASEVVVDNAGKALTAPDLILAANDKVTLAADAALTAEGGKAADALTTAGDGALLRVSGNGLGQLTRTGSPAGATGILDVNAGATLTGAAITLDATKDSTFAGRFGKSASDEDVVKALALGANRVSLGAVPTGTGGLALDDSRIAELGKIETLRLKSYSTVDLYGAASFGTNLKTLEIQAAGIAGRTNAGQTATLAATHLALSNPDGIAFDTVKPTGTGSGTLALTATDTLTLGQGDFKFDGFATSTLTARQIVATSTGSHSYAGDLTMNAGRITASSDARQKIAATGKLVTQAVAQATPFSGADFGGQLTLSGATVQHGGNIDLPAGKVVLQATAGDLELLDGSNVAATGASKTFADKTLFVSGGTVVLESTGGNVVEAVGASVDVSGAADGNEGGDAGRLEVRAAGGTATLAGALKGQQGGSNAAGGEFLLDAGSVTDLSALARKLDASGFSESVDVRARGGDMTLTQGTTLTAHEVKLAADDGNLTVAGTIDASGAKGGSIELWANRGATANTGKLKLADTAILNANATEVLAKASGTRGEGGSVTLGVSASSAAQAEEARLLMLAGSSIDVSAAGGSAASGGKVLLRAPRVGSNEIAIIGNADGALTHQTGTTSAAIGTTITGASSVVAEAVRIYETTDDLKIVPTAWQTDTANFMNNAATIESRLGWTDAAYHLRPGIEARATGNITLESDLNLWDWRYESAHYVLNPNTLTLEQVINIGEPGTLTLRAGGNVHLGAKLNDGFATTTSKIVGSSSASNIDSWSYRIVAGGDASAADPLVLAAIEDLDGKGNLTLAADMLVRTGTGSIDIAAGGNITAGTNAVIYTAGTAGATIPTAEFATIHASNNPSFPTRGGDLNLVAQGDIDFQRNGDYTVVDWLWRQGRLLADGTLGNTSNGNANNTAWWINFPQFKDGVAALGGGDVTVRAGDDISGLSVSTSTNARLKGKNILPSAENLISQGGGDVEVVAGGRIGNGEFYAAVGDMDITAGDAFGTAGAANVIAVGDSTVRVQAGSSAQVDQIVDPFLLAQAAGNVSSSPALAQNTKRITYFSNYTTVSSVALTSLSGDIALGTGTLAPATLNLAALGGSLGLSGVMALAPSPTGNLGLFAADSISIGGSVTLADIPVSSLASPLSPEQVLADATATAGHSNPPLHAGDNEPVRIITLQGDITGNQDASSLYLPKRATIQAGGDIVDLGIVGQNLAETDITRVAAGGDIVFNANRRSDGSLATNTLGIELGGPGRLEVIAGGNVDLGSSKGIVTRGNFNNPFLDDSGASILVQAGAAADYAGFLAWLESPAQAEVRALVGYTALGSDAARAAFLAQPGSAQALNDVFYPILRGVGRAAATSGSQEYAAGYAAIAALFPEQHGPYDGDIRMYYSQIKTEQGGGIDLLAPGGMANAGLAAGGDASKGASQLGIVTARGGSVRAMVRDDFAVNQSRVFTLQGGDILIWSSEGDIDAGKGAKTAATTPPPQIIVRGDQIILDTSNSVSGSGIGVLLGKDGIEPGSVDLIAPKGAVIAGDAGIRALGDIFLAGAKVIGADNIQAGGKQIGVPQVEAAAAPPPPPPPAADAAKAGEAATTAAADAARGGNVTNSILTVEIVGLGEEEEDKR
ncbi:MAG: filamentous hemagglutinin family protein [Pseudomonadota bacterium]